MHVSMRERDGRYWMYHNVVYLNKKNLSKRFCDQKEISRKVQMLRRSRVHGGIVLQPCTAWPQGDEVIKSRKVSRQQEHASLANYVQN